MNHKFSTSADKIAHIVIVLRLYKLFEVLVQHHTSSGDIPDEFLQVQQDARQEAERASTRRHFLFALSSFGNNFFYCSHCLNLITHLLLPINPVRLRRLHPYARWLGTTNHLFLFHKMGKMLHHDSLSIRAFCAQVCKYRF